MILTSSSVSELSNALTWWERGEYFFSFVVAGACFGEYVADFKPKWYATRNFDALENLKRTERRKEAISKISTLVLVAALVFELVCVVRSNALAGEVIGSINTLATNAAGQAKIALDNAGDAQKLSQSASDIAGAAKIKADVAGHKADAVAKQADAVKKELGVTEYLVSSRFLRNPDLLETALQKKYKGRTVELTSYTGDGEASGLCTQLSYVLQHANMKLINKCGKAAPTPPLVSPLLVTAPAQQDAAALLGLLGAHGLEGKGIRGPSPNLTIFVGVRTPFVIGATFQNSHGVMRITKKKNSVLFINP